jgi:hypothetical protein
MKQTQTKNKKKEKKFFLFFFFFVFCLCLCFRGFRECSSETGFMAPEVLEPWMVHETNTNKKQKKGKKIFFVFFLFCFLFVFVFSWVSRVLEWNRVYGPWGPWTLNGSWNTNTNIGPWCYTSQQSSALWAVMFRAPSGHETIIDFWSWCWTPEGVRNNQKKMKKIFSTPQAKNK